MIYRQVEQALITLLKANMDFLLICAAQDGNMFALEDLLKLEGINVNVAISRLGDSDLDTPLIVAARNGQHAVLSRLLMVPRIEVNKANARGVTALGEAALSNSPALSP